MMPPNSINDSMIHTHRCCMVMMVMMVMMMPHVAVVVDPSMTAVVLSMLASQHGLSSHHGPHSFLAPTAQALPETSLSARTAKDRPFRFKKK